MLHRRKTDSVPRGFGAHPVSVVAHAEFDSRAGAGKADFDRFRTAMTRSIRHGLLRNPVELCRKSRVCDADWRRAVKGAAYTTGALRG